MLLSTILALLSLKLVSTMPASVSSLNRDITTKTRSIPNANNPMNRRDLADIFKEIDGDATSKATTADAEKQTTPSQAATAAPTQATPTTSADRIPLTAGIESKILEALHATRTKSVSTTSSSGTLSSTPTPVGRTGPTSHSVIGTPGMSVTALPSANASINESSLLQRVQGTGTAALPSSSASSSSNTSDETSDAHRWKIAGIVLIFVALVVVLGLAIVFFDAWTRFVRDVILGRRGKRGGLGKWKGGRWNRNEPELVVDWEKRDWEYQLASEDNGHRYPSLDSGLNKMAAGKDGVGKGDGVPIMAEKERAREKVKGVVRAEEHDDDTDSAYEATAMASVGPAVPAASYPHPDALRPAIAYNAGVGMAA